MYRITKRDTREAKMVEDAQKGDKTDPVNDEKEIQDKLKPSMVISDTIIFDEISESTKAAHNLS